MPRLSLPALRRLAWLLPVCLSLALTLAGAAGAHAQEAGPGVVITSVDSRGFPTVTAYLTVSGANGLPLVGLTADNFRLREDGRSVAARTVQLASDTSQQLSLVLAIDVSTPPPDLANVQAAAVDFVNALGPNDQVALLTFYDELAEAQAFTSDKAVLAQAVQAITPGGNATVFNEAMDRSVSLLSALPGGRKAVIVFTNSGDTINDVSPEPILDAAQQAQVRIFPMSYGQNVNAELMSNWARFSGGQPYLLAGSDEVRANLLTLGVLLRQSYALTFQSALPADDATHTLTVALDYQGQSAEAEAAFTGVPGEVVVEGPGLSNGQTVRGRVFLVADVSAPAEVERVSFLLDDQPLAELTGPPYRFDWDSTTAEPGTHTLTVRALDAAGNQGETQVTVNVVLPPPVIITATPVPTAVAPAGPSVVQAFAQSALRVAWQILAAVALLAGLVVTLALWNRTQRAERQVQVKTCQVEITNQGNARSRFELRAEDPTGALKFQFALHDASLGQRVDSAAAGSAPAATAALPAPASAAGQAAPRRRAKAAVDAGIEKGQRSLSVAENISVWLMNLSYLIPGSAGRQIRSQVSQSRTLQYDVHEGLEMPGRVERMVRAATPGTVQGLSHGPAPANVAAHGNGAAAAAPGQPAALAAGAAPAALAAAGSARPGWSVTPPIEPGASLTVQLLVSPARRPRTQHYTFRVLSRTAEEAEATPLIEHGSVALQGLPWTRRAMSLALLALALGLLALLVWHALASFGVFGA